MLPCQAAITAAEWFVFAAAVVGFILGVYGLVSGAIVIQVFALRSFAALRAISFFASRQGDDGSFFCFWTVVANRGLLFQAKKPRHSDAEERPECSAAW